MRREGAAVSPHDHLFHPDNAPAYAAALAAGAADLGERLASVRRPASGRTPAEAARAVDAIDLGVPLGDLGAAVEEMTRVWLDDAVWFHDPGYAAHLNCPVVIPALVAELYLSAVNASLDTFDQSVAGTFVERRLVGWTAGRLGLPDTADGVFTSGGSQSNLQALFCARARAEQRGAPGRLRILASAEGHFSVVKAARLMGLGDDAVVPVAVDRRHRMDPVALERALAACAARGETVAAVVATAGTTDFGAIDPLPAIAELCRTYATWLHVDAAYGGGLICSARHSHRLAGIERADSVTVDFHKTFFLPVSASAVLLREARDLAAVGYHADYLNPADSDSPDQVGKSLQTTRRFDALKLWLTLRTIGADAIGTLLDDVIDLAQDVHDRMVAYDDVEVAAAPELSTIVFRFTAPGMPEEALGRLNREIRADLARRGAAVVAATRVEGRQFLKMTLLNPKATVADIARIVDLVRETGHALAGDLLTTGGAR